MNVSCFVWLKSQENTLKLRIFIILAILIEVNVLYRSDAQTPHQYSMFVIFVFTKKQFYAKLGVSLHIQI